MRLATVAAADRTGIASFEDERECRVLFSDDDRFREGLGSVLSAGAEAFDAVAAALGAAEAVRIDDLRFLPPVPRPGKVICIGMNYLGHIREVGAQVPDYPAMFVRFASSLVGHGAPILLPRVSDQLDYEGELAVIIGRRGRHIATEEALRHVAGYSVFNDASIRDYQLRTPLMTAGKNFDATGAFGPWLVTPDELPEGARGLALRTALNGEEVQRGNTDDLVFDVAKLISLLSEFTTLEPGDVIITGTPSGVGIARKPPLWMKPGDICTVEIEGIGVLSNPIAAERST